MTLVKDNHYCGIDSSCQYKQRCHPREIKQDGRDEPDGFHEAFIYGKDRLIIELR
jgi:hypothetical protein